MSYLSRYWRRFIQHKSVLSIGIIRLYSSCYNELSKTCILTIMVANVFSVGTCLIIICLWFYLKAFKWKKHREGIKLPNKPIPNAQKHPTLVRINKTTMITLHKIFFVIETTTNLFTFILYNNIKPMKQLSIRLMIIIYIVVQV